MRNGYHYLWLFRENIGKKCYAHELVAIAFIGPRPDGFQVHHINRNRLDNRPENLEYISASLHAVHHKSGEQNHRAELTEEDVILARNLFPEMRVIDIAKQLGKPYHAIWQAVHGNSWKHID
jgi:hypothetical protein